MLASQVKPILSRFTGPITGQICPSVFHCPVLPLFCPVMIRPVPLFSLFCPGLKGAAHGLFSLFERVQSLASQNADRVLPICVLRLLILIGESTPGGQIQGCQSLICSGSTPTTFSPLVALIVAFPWLAPLALERSSVLTHRTLPSLRASSKPSAGLQA